MEFFLALVALCTSQKTKTNSANLEASHQYNRYPNHTNRVKSSDSCFSIKKISMTGLPQETQKCLHKLWAVKF